MFKKMKLKNQIKSLQKEIEENETKRSRSQSALVSAILENKEPNEQDVEFFNSYTGKIDIAREALNKLTKELETI